MACSSWVVSRVSFWANSLPPLPYPGTSSPLPVQESQPKQYLTEFVAPDARRGLGHRSFTIEFEVV